jgi:class 3 adenylate cyclase
VPSPENCPCYRGHQLENGSDTEFAIIVGNAVNIASRIEHKGPQGNAAI